MKFFRVAAWLRLCGRFDLLEEAVPGCVFGAVRHLLEFTYGDRNVQLCIVKIAKINEMIVQGNHRGAAILRGFEKDPVFPVERLVRLSNAGVCSFQLEQLVVALPVFAQLTALRSQGYGGLTTVNTPNDSAVAQTLTTLRSGVLDSTISMDFLIQFLHKTTDARILAEPQINIRDNETGRLFVGQQIPVLTASQNSGSIGLSQNFEYKDVGVILEVTPHINNTGDVELKIHAESSVVVPGVTVLSGAVFDTRNFRTDLTAKDGQTLVLGGIIQKQVTDTLYKTPILGDIPGLKWLFNKKDKRNHEVELMVFLRPKVTRTPEDTKELMNEIYDKAPNVKKWKDELHPKNGTNPTPDPSGK